MIPSRAAHLLPPNHATSAYNTHIFCGCLRGLHQLRPVENLNQSDLLIGTSEPKYAYPVGEDPEDYVWLPFSNKDARVVKGPIVNDAYNRYYWTGAGVPQYNTEQRIRDGDSSFILGVPAPINAPTITPAGGTPVAARAYTYTFVSPYGEEGPPAPPTVDTGGEGTWVIGNFDTTIPSIASRAPGTWKINIYRTVADEEISRFHYVDQINLGTTSYNDTTGSDAVVLNDVLLSTSFLPPPDDLDFLTLHPNGFLVGFVGSDIYMSIPYRPHAWPAEFILSTDYDIVALGILGQSIIVGTVANPYVLSGAAPLSMTFTKVNSTMPCLSRYGMVEFPFGVVYPSERGLAMVAGGTARNITDGLVEGDQWKLQYKPTKITAAARHDDMYIGFGEDFSGFLFAPTADKNVWSRIDAYTYIDSMLMNQLTGLTYVLRGGYLYQWDDASTPPIQYRWKSRLYEFNYPVNLGAFRLFAVPGNETEAEYDLDAENAAFNAQRITFPLAPIGNNALGSVRVYSEITTPLVQNQDPFAGSALRAGGLVLGADVYRVLIYANDELVFDTLARDRELVPLPSGFKATFWQVEVRGYRLIRTITFGTSPEALKAV